MPASTLFPLPISIAQFQRNFAGLGDALTGLADYTGQTVEEIAADHIRNAQGELERQTRLAYFITRYCTEEVAARPDGAQNSGGTPLVIGTDYDRIIQPLDYIVNDWSSGSCRVVAPWRPLDSFVLYRFSFAQGGQIVDLPLGWLNNNAMTGVMNLMPQGIGITGTQYFRLLLLFPFYRGSPAGTVIPSLIHLRYSAGLVDARMGESDEYDETAAEDPQKNTRWDQSLVGGFQRAIGAWASASVMREIASILDSGGVSISFAGLSETVNPQVLAQRADANELKATGWAEKTYGQLNGPMIVMV